MMEGDGDGSGTQEDIRIVTERGEEVIGTWGNTVGTYERREVDTKEDDIFQEHAIEKHPLSIVFFANSITNS